MFDRVQGNPEIVTFNEKNPGVAEIDINRLLAFIAAGGLSGPNAGKSLPQLMFEKYDRDGSGNIEASELKDLCYDFGHYLSDDELQMAVSLIDHDGNGQISLQEFLDWWRGNGALRNLRLDEDAVRKRKEAAELFARFDLDKSGSVDRDEFVGLHEELVAKGWTRKDIDGCLDELDADGDGNIQLNELIEWLNKTAWI